MKVTAKLFAILRDRAGRADIVLDLPEGATALTAIEKLVELHPAIKDFVARSAVAINCEYVPRSTELKDRDELAIIPPVSGG